MLVRSLGWVTPGFWFPQNHWLFCCGLLVRMAYYMHYEQINICCAIGFPLFSTMKTFRDSAASLLALWRRKKVITLAELRAELQTSVRTLRRRLKEWGALASFNHNSRYYTLPELPHFDPHGLWFHREIGFSQYAFQPRIWRSTRYVWSSSRRRAPWSAVENIAKHRRVHIPAAHDATYGTFAEEFRRGQYSRQTQRSRWLGFHVRQGKQQPHCFADVLLRDLDDSRQTVP